MNEESKIRGYNIANNIISRRINRIIYFEEMANITLKSHKARQCLCDTEGFEVEIIPKLCFFCLYKEIKDAYKEEYQLIAFRKNEITISIRCTLINEEYFIWYKGTKFSILKNPRQIFISELNESCTDFYYVFNVGNLKRILQVLKANGIVEDDLTIPIDCFRNSEFLSSQHTALIYTKASDLEEPLEVNQSFPHLFAIKDNMIIQLEELSPNYLHYESLRGFQDEMKFKFYLNKERERLFQTLIEFSFNYKGKIKHIFGPSGQGKSLSLLVFARSTLAASNMLYLNIESLCNTQIDEAKKRLLNEAALFFIQISTFKKVHQSFLSTESTSIWTYIQLVLSHIYFPCLIILDQYKPQYAEENTLILLKKQIETFQFNVNIIVCWSMNNKTLKDELLKQLTNAHSPFAFTEYEYFPKLLTIKSEELPSDKKAFKDLFKLLGKLPRYLKKILATTSTPEELQNDIASIIEPKLFFNYSSTNCLSLLLSINREITEKELTYFVPFLNFKYFIIQKTDEDRYIINALFPLITQILNNKVKEQVIPFNEVGRFVDYTPSVLGYYLEFSIKQQFEKGNVIFTHLGRPMVREIPALIKSANQSKSKKIEVKPLDFSQNNSFYITQKNCNAKGLDSALYYMEHDVLKMIVFQITLKKERKEYLTLQALQSFIPELIEVSLNYFNVRIKADNIAFYYILLQEHPDEKLIEYCNQSSLQYLLFSLKDYAFNTKSLSPIPISPLAKNDILPYQNFLSNNIALQLTEFLHKKTDRPQNFVKELIKPLIHYDNDLQFVIQEIKRLLKAKDIELSSYKYFNAVKDNSITHDYALIIVNSKKDKEYILKKKTKLYLFDVKSRNVQKIIEIPTSIGDDRSIGVIICKISIILK